MQCSCSILRIWINIFKKPQTLRYLIYNYCAKFLFKRLIWVRWSFLSASKGNNFYLCWLRVTPCVNLHQKLYTKTLYHYFFPIEEQVTQNNTSEYYKIRIPNVEYVNLVIKKGWTMFTSKRSDSFIISSKLEKERN